MTGGLACDASRWTPDIGGAEAGGELTEEEDVGGLDVAVDDAGLVGGGQGVGDLAADLDRLPQREGRPALARLEILPLEPLHGDVGGLLVEPAAEELDRARAEGSERDDPHDPGVAQLREDLSLAQKTRLLGGLDSGRGDDLERDVAARDVVERPVDDADPAAADLALYSKTPRGELLDDRFHGSEGVRRVEGQGTP